MKNVTKIIQRTESWSNKYFFLFLFSSQLHDDTTALANSVAKQAEIAILLLSNWYLKKIITSLMLKRQMRLKAQQLQTWKEQITAQK